MKNIYAHKSLLAKLLATENIDVVHDDKAPTAYMDLENRKLVLPEFHNISEEVYDMLIGHEVSHALNTPKEGWHSSLEERGLSFKSYLNVSEDARIEKLICKKFPGLKKQFVTAYKQLMDRDFFELKEKNLNELALVDRLNLYMKVGPQALIQFSDIEKPFVSRAETLQTFADSESLAIDLWNYAKELKKKEETQKKQQEQKQDGKPSDETEEKGNSPSDSDQEEESEENSKPKPTSEESKEESKDEGASPSEPDSSLTDNALQKNLSSLSKNENTRSWNKGTLNLTIPTSKDFDVEKVIVGYNEIYDLISSAVSAVDGAPLSKDYEKFNNKQKQYKNVISNYVNQFNAKKQARAYQRTSQAKSGRIDNLKLVNYKLIEDIFLMNDVVHNDKSHGFVVYVDWSNSMSNIHTKVFNQLFVITSFFRQINVPYRVFAFSDKFAEGSNYQYTDSISNVRIDSPFVVHENFRLLELFSNKQSKVQHKEVFSFLFNKRHHYACSGKFSLGYTPLIEAIASAFQTVPKFKEQTKIDICNLVFMTDGDHAGHNPYVGLSKVMARTLILKDKESKLQRVASTDPKNQYEARYNSLAGSFISLLPQMMISILQEKYNIRAVNFFMLDKSTSAYSISYRSGFNDQQKITKDLKENFAFTYNEGEWAAQYFIKSIQVKAKILKETTSSGNISKGNLIKNFVGNGRINKISRYIANEFISIVA